MSVDWGSYNKYDDILEEYLPSIGEGDSLASQMVTAVNKLIYKWYNDGDVYDNSGYLSGWMNDLSSYANWLRKYSPFRVDQILDRVYTCGESEYEDLLAELAEMFFDPSLLDWASKQPKQGTIYKCDGPYRLVEDDEDEEDDEYWDDSEYDDEEDLDEDFDESDEE